MSLTLLFISLQIAVFTVVFSCILIEKGQIFEFYGNLLRRLPEWVGDPLGLCAYCFGGQISLWYFVYRIFFIPERYDGFIHLSFIAVTIFLIHLILYVYEKTE
jgi:hypothetical protein